MEFLRWVNCVLNSHTVRCASVSPQTQPTEEEPSALSLLAFAAVTINNFAYKEIRGGIAAHLSAQLQNIPQKRGSQSGFLHSSGGSREIECLALICDLTYKTLFPS
jgi:hypothetical protein